jgi:GTP-binding protein HflX
MMKFSSRAIAEHDEVPLADDGRFEELVDYWTSLRAPTLVHGAEESVSYVVSVGASREPHARAAQLAEIVALVRSQGGRVAGEEICHVSDPNPRTLLGKGSAQAIAARARAAGATMLVLDAELSPSQARNLEDVAGIAICDREAIILNVFLRHARTRRARIQVEIAQLEYLRPRIRGIGLDMDQQTGGTTYARGPGETASELLARKLDGRLVELNKALRKMETSAKTQRKRRAICERMVLVGYTNAGKTSLMNALTASELSARDMPFETLDTTSRCLTRHGGEVVLSDTVGFIRRLPQRLTSSFESTLAEITEAALLVIVLDASDCELELHLRTTLEVLKRLAAERLPRFYVFNKLDRVQIRPPDQDLSRWTEEHPWAALSAHDAEAVAALGASLLSAVRRAEGKLRTFIPYEARDVMALAYGKCRVITSVATERGLTLELRGPHTVLSRIRHELEARQ